MLTYYNYSGEITSSRDDWSTFGSVLAGASSLLAAIGTVGVLLLSIKQFNVQQDQIEAQSIRQDDFETKQQEKWNKENEMLNFKKYQLHVVHFEKMLEKIELTFKLSFQDKPMLYKKCFVNNSFKEVHFNIDEGTTSWPHLLEQGLSNLHQSCQVYCRHPSASNISKAISNFITIKKDLDFTFNQSNNNDDEVTLQGLPVSHFYPVVEIALYTLKSLQLLAEFQSSITVDEIQLSVGATTQDLLRHDTKEFTSEYSSFYELLILLNATMKPNFSPLENNEALLILTQHYEKAYFRMYYHQSKLAEINNIIYSSVLPIEEIEVLVAMHDQCSEHMDKYC